MATNSDIISMLSDIKIDQNEQKVRLESLGDKMDDMQIDVEKIETTLNGNGKAGYNVRMDRLEQSENRRKWLNRTLYAGFISLVLYEIFQI